MALDKNAKLFDQKGGDIAAPSFPPDNEASVPS